MGSTHKKRLQSRLLAKAIKSRGLNDPINQMRAAVFQLVTIKVGGRTKRMPLLSAYQKHLVDAGARGSVSAFGEQMWVTRHLLSKDELFEPELEHPAIVRTRAKITYENKMSDRLRQYCAYIFLDLVREFNEH